MVLLSGISSRKAHKGETNKVGLLEGVQRGLFWSLEAKHLLYKTQHISATCEQPKHETQRKTTRPQKKPNDESQRKHFTPAKKKTQNTNQTIQLPVLRSLQVKIGQRISLNLSALGQ